MKKTYKQKLEIFTYVSMFDRMPARRIKKDCCKHVYLIGIRDYEKAMRDYTKKLLEKEEEK